MKAGFVQFNPAFGQVNKNLQTINRMVTSVKADLLVLPELCLSGYNFVSKDEVRQLAETVNGPSIKSLKLLSKKTGTILVAGFAERSGNKIYNSAILIRYSGKSDIYRKTHLFWNEKKWFAPGDTGFKVFSAGQARIGMMICYDWFFPEAARSLALQGAQIICHPANLVLPHCPRSMPVRALENKVFTITANRVGREKRGRHDLHFIGQSIMAGPDQSILASAAGESEAVRVIDIDPKVADNKRATPLNQLFRDRRPEYYV
ncbi:acyltransferase [candidate division TA06 bacterium]|uniref:Acyltransferase n=1 Tax=candidate division TA06 bacterium TaxID=2250710 RepID=A0A933I9H9_UNCT6|nr:acyltransferase [candidate division TA06 bacterium]